MTTTIVSLLHFIQETKPVESVRDEFTGDEEYPSSDDFIYDSTPVYDEYTDDEWYSWMNGGLIFEDGRNSWDAENDDNNRESSTLYSGNFIGFLHESGDQKFRLRNVGDIQEMKVISNDDATMVGGVMVVIVDANAMVGNDDDRVATGGQRSFCQPIMMSRLFQLILEKDLNVSLVLMDNHIIRKFCYMEGDSLFKINNNLSGDDKDEVKCASKSQGGNYFQTICVRDDDSQKKMDDLKVGNSTRNIGASTVLSKLNVIYSLRAKDGACVSCGEGFQRGSIMEKQASKILERVLFEVQRGHHFPFDPGVMLKTHGQVFFKRRSMMHEHHVNKKIRGQDNQDI
ncbi:hypothetical protein QVD17_41629 [Tagetes erecta]|uniref:Uncharacterized protein n=1 Tax=Tagetes erecta TaxID=13708 RepID=A0AAD8N911_TARER|nr:hypothetical protein QVD17_41629 [Tagetes erecta]